MLDKFLEKLGSDTELLEAYKKDPKGVMKQHGLSNEEIEAVMTGDLSKVSSISGLSLKSSLLLVHDGNEK